MTFMTDAGPVIAEPSAASTAAGVNDVSPRNTPSASMAPRIPPTGRANRTDRPLRVIAEPLI